MMETTENAMDTIRKTNIAWLIERKDIHLYLSIYRSNDLPYNGFYCDISPPVPHAGCYNYGIFNSKCCASKN